jgi:hypothetical protein
MSHSPKQRKSLTFSHGMDLILRAKCWLRGLALLGILVTILCEPELAAGADPGIAIIAPQGSLALQVTAPTQPPFKVQVSTNLKDWMDWKLVTNSPAQFVFKAEGMTNWGHYFFRRQPLELSLLNWSLTLPIDTNTNGIADEILQPQLATFQKPPYFLTNSAGNGLVFIAPCGGVTTKGSQYPRSELREMATQGLERAAWSTTNGTHTLEIIQAVNHLPVVKPQIVIGQIHNAIRDQLTFRLQNHDLLIDHLGVKSPLSTTPYQLGDVFSVKFVAHDGKVDCYFNGQFVQSLPVEADGCYFKAGCYTQSNVSKGDASDAYGEVVIYGLSVTHE